MYPSQKLSLKKEILLCLISFIMFFFFSCSINSTNDVNDKQSGCVDSKTVNVYTPAEYLKGNVDKVVISDSLLDESNASRRAFDVEYSKSENGFSVVYHDLKYYGKHKLVAKYYSGSTLLGEEVQNVTATASEYNMPCLIATVPVTDYTLMAVDSYREDYFNSNLPTIITLERAQAYNWDNLPDNMQVCPFLSDDWIENGVYANNWNYETAYSIYWEYVEYLYNLNSSSKFNFYLNDYWPDYFINAFYIGIPLDQMSVTFITDGTASFSMMRSIYGEGGTNDDSLTKYSTYENSWNAIKSKIKNGESVSLSDFIDGGGAPVLRAYIPVLINDLDLKSYWIVNNNSENNFGSSAVYTTKVKNSSHFVCVNMGNLLNALNSNEKESLKALYSFDNTALKEAETNGKKCMIFLGTSTSGEGELEDAIKIMKGILGDEYAYFYKGHPGHVMNDDGRREKIMSDNDVTIIDASTPAELVYFFNPTVEMCGYQSSTFVNIGKDVVPYIFFPAAKSDELDYFNKINVYSEVVSGSEGYRIVKDALTSPKWTTWDKSSSFGSLTWTEGLPE